MLNLRAGHTVDRPGSPARQRSPKRQPMALGRRACKVCKDRTDDGRRGRDSSQRRGRKSPRPDSVAMAESAKHQTERAYVQYLRDHIADLERAAHRKETPDRGQYSHVEATVDPGLGVPMIRCPTTSPAPSDQTRGAGMGLTTYELPIHTLRRAASATDDWSPPRQVYSRSPNRSLTPPLTLDSLSLRPDNYALPSRRVADWLVQIYFARVYPFYPWVHQETFLDAYNRLWLDQNEPPSDLPDVGLGGGHGSLDAFHCALNAIFGLACEFSNMAPGEKRRSSAMFGERMQSLLSMGANVPDSGSLSDIQALLLVGLYLQCTRHPERSRSVIGTAYQKAVGLGLQIEDGRIESEMRRRVWCACVQMDLVASIIAGRRSTLNHPLTTRDTRGNQFADESMKLLAILGNILAKIYHAAEPGAEASSVDFQAIFEINHALEAFQGSLPPALHWNAIEPSSNTPKNPIHKRQSNILHARFLYLKLLLYRPAFSKYCSTARESDRNSPHPSNPRLEECALECLHSASELTMTLQRATSEDKTSAWWFGAFPLVNAGIVLIIADATAAGFGDRDMTGREIAWNRCFETLHRMVEVHPSSRDCAIALSGLKNRYSGETVFNRPKKNPQLEVSLGQWDQVDHPSERNQSWCGEWDTVVLNWGSRQQDIMLPAQILQQMDEDLMLPSLF